ncbi:uncharacterized protein LOC130724666 [Lotus japonicus]|uniref:uncharacterized protein LOC130724666 n=1 Tax=Lotus japonicus TaxID=34305 RepID=UPI002583F2AF|nr:uncharacterized protein LOC130724666 [Lotus japonicus]
MAQTNILQTLPSKLFNNVLAPPDMTMQQSLKNFAEWEEAQGWSTEKDITGCKRKWEPPPEGVFKINVDAGWTGSSSTCFGMVVRAHDSKLMVAASFFEPHRMDPTIAEAMALRWYLQTAVDMEIEDAIIESDSQIVIGLIADTSLEVLIPW